MPSGFTYHLALREFRAGDTKYSVRTSYIKKCLPKQSSSNCESKDNANRAVSMHKTKMNISHTIKDKEIPRWHPLQRVPRIALSKLSPKRLLFLLLILGALLFFLTPSYVNRAAVIDPEENDDQVLLELRKEFKSLLSMRGEFSTAKQNAIFITAHDLYNATGLTMLACEMAMAKKLNVLMIFVGMNSTEKVAFFLRANQFDRATCPMAWYDARHEYSSLNVQENATESVLKDVVTALQPSVVVYLDDDADWFMQSFERVVYWKRPAISLIQLKRADIQNLRWIGSLNPSALAAWNVPQIDIVITTQQVNTGTLYRLIQSLLSAEYIQPTLPRLFITFNPNTTTPELLKLLREWPSDRLILRHQIYPLHTSFPGALQSWYPSDEDNYVLVLQDNVELSPWYMYWLQLSLMKYVYSDPHPDPSVSLLTGISLQSAPQSDVQNKKTLDIRRALLMAPMYSGWLSYSTPYIWQETLFHSTLFFPSQWKEFHTYISLREHFGGGIPSITDSLAQFSHGEELALEIYWLELLLARGYAILYSNFDDGASFAVQHSESLTAESQVETPLLEWGQLFEQIDDGLPDWEDLPVLDFENRVVGWDQLDRTSKEYQSHLSSCTNFPEQGWEVRDLFCFAEDDAYRWKKEEKEEINDKSEALEEV